MIPDFLLQHTVSIEPAKGFDGFGNPLFGPSESVRCLLDQSRKRVTDVSGEQVTAEALILAQPDTTAPVHSRVTLPDGRQARVILTKAVDGGNLPVPSHVEIYTT